MTIVVGHDGSDSGDDAATLGAQLAKATGEGLLVVTVYPEENPIGIGRVDAEWVEAMGEHAREVSDCAKRTTASWAPARRHTASTTSPRASTRP
jgi:nucleotide-binding universal stress UspA family protein